MEKQPKMIICKLVNFREFASVCKYRGILSIKAKKARHAWVRCLNKQAKNIVCEEENCIPWLGIEKKWVPKKELETAIRAV